MNTPIPLRTRVLSRLLIDPESGCVLWTGRMTDGYGRVNDSTVDGVRRSYLVHRLMWEWFEGPIPDGMMLDHVRQRGCLNRHCAAIAHLEPVTNAENIRRAGLWSFALTNASKTHCIRGHEFTPENTYRLPRSGRRQCRTCHNARASARKRALREGKAA